MNFEQYKLMLDQTDTEYEVYPDGTVNVVDVENDDACFSVEFDKLTGVAVSTRIYSRVYCD